MHGARGLACRQAEWQLPARRQDEGNDRGLEAHKIIALTSAWGNSRLAKACFSHLPRNALHGADAYAETRGRAGIASRLATLIALSIAQSISLGIQQRVQRLLHATPDPAVEVSLDPLIINRDDIAQWTRCSLSHGGSFLLSWLCLA